jgi:hypothetical protein
MDEYEQRQFWESDLDVSQKPFKLNQSPEIIGCVCWDISGVPYFVENKNKIVNAQN